jgi:hypothetical protein
VTIHLHIDRIVLEGALFQGWTPRFIQAAVARELTRLLSEAGPAAHLASGGSLASIDGGSLYLAADTDATGLGQQIAGSLHASLGGPR